MSVDTKTVVSCEKLSRSFQRGPKRVEALQDVSLSFDAGEFVAVCGKSGCGKSTLMLCLGGLQKPDSGEVIVNQQSLYSMTADQRAAFRANHIGYVFQQFHLIPYLTVLENVMAARIGARGGVNDGTNDSRTDAAELIERVGLSARLDHKPSELSIGECQRVAIARSLMNRPLLILADEPTGNLDEENTENVLNQLKEISNEGTTVILVTHDTQCEQFADRIVRMSAGQIESTP